MATIPSTLERLNYGAPAGCIGTGQHRQIIDGVGATRTLLAEESGALCLFDAAAGNIFTLPAPAVGMWFEFQTTTAVTSNAQKVITNAATVFLLGSVLAGELAAAMDVFQANGSTHVAISSNGSTTGGLVGSNFKVTCISSTQWVIEGTIVGSGTLADPFATS